MVFLLNALTISSKRVFSTLWNIILFRYVYEFVKSRIFTGVVGFIIAIYVSDYIRKFLYRQWAALKKRAFQNSKTIENEFDPKYLESIVLEYDQLENTTENDELNKTLLKFKERTQIKCKNDLFDYIFTASTHSVLLSFITMFSIEIVQSNYGYGVMTSILYCSTIPFILCFGSSYRYSSVLSKEWLGIFEKKGKQKLNQKSNQILVYYNKSKAEGGVAGENNNLDYACLWSSHYMPSTRITTIELKFLSSTYSNRLQDVIQYYFLKYVNLNDEHEAEYYDVIVPDFYNVGYIFSNIAKKFKLKSIDSWTEFILFPSINFNVNIFSNKNMQSKSKEN